MRAQSVSEGVLITSPCPRRGRRKPRETRCRRERCNADRATTQTLTMKPRRWFSGERSHLCLDRRLNELESVRCRALNLSRALLRRAPTSLGQGEVRKEAAVIEIRSEYAVGVAN